MHIPSSMLHGAICPVTAAVSTISLAGAAYAATKISNKPSAARFAAVTALIFAGQMMNFPIQSGTSGHLLGGVLASALLGIPFGVLAVALVLTVQCLVFSDGGLAVLGANILNMAVLGAGAGGFFYQYFLQKEGRTVFQRGIGIGLAAWVSTLLAALACSVELAVSGTVAFTQVSGAMLSTHALIGIGEATITLIALPFFAQEGLIRTRWAVAAPAAAAMVIAAMLSPFASGWPDGLEWVAQKYQFLHESAPAFVSPMPDYAIPVISHQMISVGLAGLAGALITFAFAWVLGKGLHSLSRSVA
ncbi:MAG: energy-coupling factor ABC transporter permease [Candidatus Aceula meridiana]|nr:energy-coupling factor ABC transporter permease [Candidatus Aceula meridiana]